MDLAKAADIHQGNVDLWFEVLDDFSELEALQLCYLLERGFDLDDALERCEEVCIYHRSAEDYAQELIEEIAEIPETLRFYIDYAAIARDMKLNGEIEELDRELIVTNGYDF